MKHRPFLFLLLLLMPAYCIVGQTADDGKRREMEIREAVTMMMGPGDKVRGVRTDLRVFEGKLVRSDDKGFVIEPKKKSALGVQSVMYTSVLEIDGERVSLSYFPDPNQKPFADWNAIRRLNHGDSLDIDLLEKKSAFGVLLRTSETDLTLLDGNRNVVVRRDQILRVLLARRDTPGAKRILKGAAKGAKATGPRSGDSSIGAAVVNTAIMAGGAVAGAVSAAAKRWPNDRLLIYAK